MYQDFQPAMNKSSRLNRLARKDMMGIIFGVIGVFLLLLGLVAGIPNEWNRISGLFIFGCGYSLVRAAVTGHKGEWATLIGVALIAFSGIGLGSEAENYVQGVSRGPSLMIVGFFFLSGLLLLLTGQRTHGYAVELQKLRAGLEDQGIENAAWPSESPPDKASK